MKLGQRRDVRLFKLFAALRRSLTTSSRQDNQRGADAASRPAISPRWLSDSKNRIGRCISFGLKPELVEKAGRTLQVMTQNWRNLVAGSEGFVTDPKRAGLHRQSIVWGDQDAMGHVNNVMYVRYAESGRCNWTRNIGQHFDVAHRGQWAELLSPRGTGLILKSITVDFKFPLTWPDRVSVYHKLRNRPDENTDSLILDVLILSEGKQRAAARCLEDVVVYDYRMARKTTLPAFVLEQFKQIWQLQEAAKNENCARLQQIEAEIRYLEQQSWDRPDAKEDFGGNP